MFNQDEFIKTNILQAFKEGSFSEAQVNLFCMNYLMRSMISQETFDSIQAEIKAIKEAKAQAEAERKRKEEELKKAQEELEKAQAEHDKAQQDLDEANSQMKTAEATENENVEQAIDE